MANTSVQFLDEFFPIVVCVSPSVYDDVELKRLFDGYRRYFERGERYALVSHTPKAGVDAPARARKAIADWANTPEVRAKSRALCVGSATVVPNAVSRGVMTALLWLWSPSSPHHLASSTEDAVDWCIERLVEGKVPMRSAAPLRAAVIDRLRAF